MRSHYQTSAQYSYFHAPAASGTINRAASRFRGRALQVNSSRASFAGKDNTNKALRGHIIPRATTTDNRIGPSRTSILRHPLARARAPSIRINGAHANDRAGGSQRARIFRRRGISTRRRETSEKYSISTHRKEATW